MCDNDLVSNCREGGEDICEKCGVTVSDRLRDITRPEWNNILGIGKTNKELAEQGQDYVLTVP